ncbi:hypothetical protein BX666DRAFT_1977115 [Dichotomocladium elegans]|nr:hypothetical protein BX666DRAFT_1977115 [Dichotomocladium elegans]
MYKLCLILSLCNSPLSLSFFSSIYLCVSIKTSFLYIHTTAPSTITTTTFLCPHMYNLIEASSILLSSPIIVITAQFHIQVHIGLGGQSKISISKPSLIGI